MKLLQQIFNSPPSPGARSVYARDGKKFWLVLDDNEKCSRIDIWYRGDIVGWVYFDWHDNLVMLADLVIHKSGLRRHGLGVLMLKHALGVAKQQGATAMIGRVSKEDLKENPNLLNWYQQHDFQVRMIEGDHWAADIYISFGS